MAIYSLRLTPIGKTTQKRPFTAAAHVRYIARPGAATHVMAERMPENKGRAQRWLRSAEKADRKNARVADKLVIALPLELTLDQNIDLVRTFAETLTRGRASWFAAIHARGKDRQNPHVHILVRDRDVQTGARVVMFSAGPKEVQQRAAKGKAAPTTLHLIRELWEKSANAALAEAGRRERIDRRRLRAQGIARPAQVHEGPNIRAMHHRGYRPRSTDRVYRNRPGRRARERTVRYGEIDRGLTRVEYNEILRLEARGSAAAVRVVQAVPLTVTKPLVQVALRTASSSSPVAAMPEIVERRAESRSDAMDRSTFRELTSLVTGGPSSYGPSMATSPQQADPATALRLRFAEGRTTLVEALRGSFQQPDEVADALLSHADEFGPQHAAERFLAAPESFGARVAGAPAKWPLAGEDLASALKSLVDGHDELDRETRRQDDEHDRVGKTGQTIHVQGEAFTLDADQRTLVSRDGKTALPLEGLDRDVSFMERLIDEEGPREEPVRSGRDRTTPERGR